jgi:hypothetical protein
MKQARFNFERAWMLLATALVALAEADSAHAQCASDAECKGDRICVQGKCTASSPIACGKDVDCPDDLVCSGGACRESANAGAAPEAVTLPEVSGPAATVMPDPPPAPAPAATAHTALSSTTGGEAPTPETRPILGLVIAGPVVLGVTWLATIAGTAALSDGDGEPIGYSAIPLAGPWIMIGALDTGSYTPALVVSGILQASGVVMTILGVAIRTEEPAAHAEGARRRFGVAPFASHDGAGLAAGGTF